MGHYRQFRSVAKSRVAEDNSYYGKVWEDTNTMAPV
jgi:hypothetical protein